MLVLHLIEKHALNVYKAPFVGFAAQVTQLSHTYIIILCSLHSVKTVFCHSCHCVIIHLLALVHLTLVIYRQLELTTVLFRSKYVHGAVQFLKIF